jgi:hypothetical protein
MGTTATAKGIDHDRPRLLDAAAMGFAVAGAASLFPPRSVAAGVGDAIRPFRVDVQEDAIGSRG